jgi:hypothetical protein
VRQSDGAESFAACGQRRGLLALDLGSIFKKLLHQKTFISLRSATVIKIDFRAVNKQKTDKENFYYESYKM